MRTRAALLLAAALPALGACVVLPIPQRVVHYPTLVGQLVHQESGAPAVGVLVSIGEPGACPCTRSNERGEFELVATGRRFPYTSAWALGDEDPPTAEVAVIWATLGSGAEATHRRVGQILFYPPTFADPGGRNEIPAELGVIRF
jgi:hypothetical protein